MGRKKPTVRDEEGGAAVGGGKSKKKGFVVDDDEYSIGTELSEEVAAQEEKVAPVGNKKKGKKGGNKKMEVKDEDEEFGDNRVDEEDDEDDAPVMKFTGKKKGKGRKGGSNSTFSASGFGLLGEDDSEGGDEGGQNDDDDDGEDVVAFKGKKKPSKSKKGGGGFGLLGEDDNDDSDEGGQKDDDEDGEDVVAFKGKKKPSKSKKGGAGAGSVFSSSAFGALSDDEDEDSAVVDDDDEDVPVISFSGKKKPSKSKKGGGGFAAAGFDVLNEEEEDKGDDKSSKDEDEDVPEITFAGKKKKSSKGSKKVPENSFSAAVLDEEIDEDISVLKSGDGESDDQDEDISAIKFSGKKKSSKKKKSGSDSALENGINEASSEVTEPDRVNTEVVSKTTNEPVAETSSKNKNKKKKKKGGKAGEEEDDLDKILAEIGGAPSVSQPASTSAAAPPGDNIQSQPDLEGAAATKEAEGPDESVTSKKKKKKKDKEKEKKASAAGPSAEEKQEETKTDVKSKVPEKKVPKHVREMQERLARAEEQRLRREREQEEKLRREEEERLRLEELERQAEEKKRLKKEKMKEKIEQKKKDGTYKTAKQKEADKKLEALRLQLLAKSGDLQLGESSRPATKKPLYQKKKSKPQAQSNGAGPLEVEEEPKTEVDAAAEAGDVEEAESSGEKDKSEVNYDVKENQSEKGGGDDDGGDDDGDDDDEEWDAKSWDEADLKLPGKSAFSDEEVESEPEALAKELKTAKTASQDVQLRTGATKPIDYREKITSGVPHRSIAEAAATEGNKVGANSDTNKSSQIEGGQDLRSPICCIMGHVDTGKTKLLDCIRGTDVQGGEAGGITQQIGATYFPAKNIRDRTKELKADAKLNVPGLLVIDTPGHESFTNLRSRGSGLCDIAILVVDIMHGLEPQTIESLNLLRMRDTEFIVALNKVDRLYGWKTCKNAPIAKAMKQQSKDVQNEFNRRLTEIITEFKMQGLNTELYYKNKEMGETFSIVPTSAISGEGIPDLLLLLVQWTQKTMIERLTFSNEVQCTVLEVKVIEGHGTTIDVVLVNGVLHEGDQVVVCGLQGPIVTSIRALLTPHPMKELRVKGTYLHHKEIKAAQGIKITAQGLEHAIAGTSLYVVGPDDDIEDIKDSAMEDMKSVMSRIDKSGVGVYVQASTLGSLEALLEFLKSPAVSIPVSGISIGPVHKKDVMKASVMLEKNKEYGTILAFDVKVTPEARDLAEELGVKIFIADIIYHLFDQFKAYIDNIKEEKKKEAADEAVFPCVLKIMPNCVFNKKDPIVLGVEVAEGTAKIGTPICVPQKEFIEIGRIASIENNHKAVDFAKKGQKVAIKIIGSNSEEQQKMFGRHFEMEDELVSKISRNSLDALKEHYADDITKDVKQLLFKLKKVFKIP